MFERMLDKHHCPDEKEIASYIGNDEVLRLKALEDRLHAAYDIHRELCFPFGNAYGWGYKYSHKSTHLCHVFFEDKAINMMLQLGDKVVSAVEKALPDLSMKTNQYWKERYPCGDHGGWVNYRILSDEDLNDALCLLAIRKKPMKLEK